MKGKLPAAPLRRAWSGCREFARRRKPWLAWGAAAAGFAFIVLLVHRSAYGVLVSQPEYRLRSGALVRVAPLSGAADATVEIPADLSLFDDALVARVGRSFEGNPWVRRVKRVERCFPDRIRVRFEVRQPRLAVRRPEGVVLLDEERVVLPGLYASAPASCAVWIVGVAAAPPRAGLRWDAPDVKAGAELAALAASAPQLRGLDVRAVDVSNVRGRLDRRRPETAFVTAGGCTIYWGRAPSDAGFGEPGPAQKLGLLAAVLDEYPKLDGLKYVKLHAGGRAAVCPASPGETRLGQGTRR